MKTYNEKHLNKAVKLAEDLKFEEFEVSEKHFDNRFDLFVDDNGGTWSILPTYNDKFNICYEGEKVSSLSESITSELNEFIEFQLDAENIQNEHDQEYKDLQNELWKNYGYGKI